MDRDNFPNSGPSLLDDADDDVRERAETAGKRIKRGAAVGVLVALGTAALFWAFAPPIPAGDWAVYVRLIGAVISAGIAFVVVWFLTIARTVGGGL